MVNKKTIIIVLFIMFPVVMMVKQPLKPEACPVTDAINKHKDEVKKEQERVKKLIDEVAREIELSCSPSCPVGWVNNGDKCYFIDDTATPKQADARAACQNMGGDLAIIKSAEENEFIRNLVISQSRVTKFGAWLGFQRKEVDSDFYWIDDTPLEGGYTNWASYEPNDYRDIEDCADMFGKIPAISGKWNDFPCDFTLGSIPWTSDDSPVVLCQKPL